MLELLTHLYLLMRRGAQEVFLICGTQDLRILPSSALAMGHLVWLRPMEMVVQIPPPSQSLPRLLCQPPLPRLKTLVVLEDLMECYSQLRQAEVELCPFRGLADLLLPRILAFRLGRIRWSQWMQTAVLTQFHLP